MHASSASGQRFQLTYALTPPNRTTPAERRAEIAAAQSARITSLPIDAVLVYDVQDEAARNGSARPFPFVPKLDPLTYAFEALNVGTLPRIVYRAIADQDEKSLGGWLANLRALGGSAVLVGAPSRSSQTSLTLAEAYDLCRSRTPDVRYGGVLIPERHRGFGSEDARVWAKKERGCTFFVSQTVWSVGAATRLLRDLHERAQRLSEKVPRILLTFSPCGSPQTLQFTEWLGVELPASVKSELLGARNMLERSVDLAAANFAEIRASALELGLDLGCNVESVSSRAAEVEASVELVHRVCKTLEPTKRLRARAETASTPRPRLALSMAPSARILTES